MVADECHHVPAVGFEQAGKQIPARRWLGLTATPYRRDKLDDLISMHVGPVRHTITVPREPADGSAMLPGSAPGGRPTPVLHLHRTRYCFTGDASPSAPGGMAIIYKDLIADDERTLQVVTDVAAALAQGRNCLVLTNWTAHLEKLAARAMHGLGHEPVVLRGGREPRTGQRRSPAFSRQPGGPPLLAVATGPYAGEGFGCPPLDTLFLAAPAAQKGILLQYAGRILRPYDGTLDASSAPMTVRPPPRSTTITTNSPASLPHHWPSAHPATPASASPTPGNFPARPAPRRRAERNRGTATTERVVVRLSGMSFEIDDDTIASAGSSEYVSGHAE